MVTGNRKNNKAMMEQEEKNKFKINDMPLNYDENVHGCRSSKISSFYVFLEKLSSSSCMRWLIIVLLPVLIFLRYTVDAVDYDLWWQMAHGKYYITHHTLKMDLSMFSWTPTDPGWIYNTCLGSIVIYLFYDFMGGFGLWLMQWLIFGGVFLSFYLFLRLLNQRLDINSVTIIAAVGIACSMASRFYKPELFSLLIFCWTVFIFFYIRITRRKLLFYLYPLIFVFWVNLHGAFIVGLVFLALAFTGEILNRIFYKAQSFSNVDLIHFGIACLLSCLVTLLNPYSIDYLLPVYKMIVPDNSQLTQLHNKSVMAYSILWPYLKVKDISFFGGGLTAWIMTIMIFSILSISVYEFIKKKSCDFTLLIISIALYLKGMETIRASYFFPVAFFFIFFYLLMHNLKLEKIPGRATLYSLVVFIFFFASIFYVHVVRFVDNKWFGIGIEGLAPVKEVAFLKKCKPEGPMFNDYTIGGYLVWALYPDYRVFIDPRGGLYRNEVFSDYMQFTSKQVNLDDINRFRQKYPFKIAVLHYREMPLIVNFLESGGEWHLVYFDKHAAVLVHKSNLPAVLSKIRDIDLSPLRFREEKNPDTLLKVFDFYVRLNPQAGRYIYNIFKKNVRDLNNQKQSALNNMDIQIRLREKALQKKVL
jgi:hypothetical protein